MCESALHGSRIFLFIYFYLQAPKRAEDREENEQFAWFATVLHGGIKAN